MKQILGFSAYFLGNNIVDITANDRGGLQLKIQNPSGSKITKAQQGLLWKYLIAEGFIDLPLLPGEKEFRKIPD